MIPRSYLPLLCVALLSGPPLLIFRFHVFFLCLPPPPFFFFSCSAIASLTASVHTSSGPVPTQTKFPWQQIHSELQVTNRLSAPRAKRVSPGSRAQSSENLGKCSALICRLHLVKSGRAFFSPHMQSSASYDSIYCLPLCPGG